MEQVACSIYVFKVSTNAENIFLDGLIAVGYNKTNKEF